jgi:SAM-dependent methyltransferase
MERLLEATYKAEQAHFWFHGFRRFLAPLIAQALEGRPAPVMLDCGCGTGNNLSMLKPHGRAFGFDLTFLGLQFAQRYGHPEVVQASVTDVPFKSAHFDLLTSFDVLYALTDEQEAATVAEMWRLLKPGGHVIVNVAAFNALKGNHSVLGQERRRYTKARLRRALEAAGFVIRRITYTNATLFPLMLAVRTAQRAVGLADAANADSEIAVPSAPVNTAMKAALTLEAGMLRVMDMPFGSSLLCLAQKPE